MNFVPRRPGGRLFIDGRPDFPSSPHPENPSQFERPDRDALSQRVLNGKLRPIIRPRNGMNFPNESQPETASHSRQEFRDTLSANKEGHITWPSTYICSAGALMTSRASTPRRLPGDAECEVHREFRTSRRALNVLSVRAGLPEQATLCLSDCPGPTCVTTAQYRQASPNARPTQYHRS